MIQKHKSKQFVTYGANCLSKKKKSRHSSTIRKNKQTASTAGSSSSHLNRTESSQSNNVGTTSNFISLPCFPPVVILMRITVTLYQIVPRHLILQRIVLLIFPKSEQGQLQKNYATGKSKRILFEK